MTKILGQAQAAAEQMAAYLLSVNPSPRVGVAPLALCRMYLEQGEREGVRGDALFAQSCKETGHFAFSGTVSPGQNNFAGLGTTNPNTPGASFSSPQEGILAQAQHARGYATAAGLICACVDPRYSLLERYGKRGSAKHWEELGGKWAVPGYDTKRYGSLEEADAAEDSYGYQVVRILQRILAMPKTEEDVRMERKPIIALDAGHGMKTAGKRCLKSLDLNQTREWFLNDRILDRVEDLLSGCHCTILRVDDTTGGKDISLAARVKTANAAGADLYISMHHNAGLSGRRGGGTVVFYCSGKAERQVQAQRLYDAVVSRTGLRGNRSAKVVNKGFYVIKNTSMPAFLVENGFMDSPDDVPVILSAEHAEKTAEGVVAFIEDMLQLEAGDKAASGSVSSAAGTGPGGMAVSSGSSTYYPAYRGKKTILTEAMASLGINSSYAHRKQIAAANGIVGYIGAAAQNTKMYNMLAAGLLKKE